MEPLLTLINDSKSPTPSLNKNISTPPISKVSPNPSFPIKNIKDNTNKFHKDNKDNRDNNSSNNSDNSFIENLNFISSSPKQKLLLHQQQPPSPFPKISSDHKLPAIEETKRPTTTIQESILEEEEEDQLLLPTTSTLYKDSLSDGPLSSRVSEIKISSVLGEEKRSGREISYGTIQSHIVYSHNRDGLSNKMLTTEYENNAYNENNENNENLNNSKKNITNPISTPSSTHFSSVLSSSPPSTSLDPIHSDTSLLDDIDDIGNMYNAIRDDKDDDHSGVSVSSHPSPMPISNVTPLRKENNKRFGIKEDKYPSPGAYFSMKNNSMGNLGGPHKRPIFLSASNRRLHDTPTVDTSRPERNKPSRMTKMEGWPSSPRRMQMVSPRFKSLSDLMEGPEGSEQQPSENSGGNLPIPSKTNLISIVEDTEDEPNDNIKNNNNNNNNNSNNNNYNYNNSSNNNNGMKQQEKFNESAQETPKEYEENDTKKNNNNNNSNNNNESNNNKEIFPSSDMNMLPFRMHRPITSSGQRSFSNTKKLFVYKNIGEDSVSGETITEEDEEEEEEEGETSENSDQDSAKGYNEKRLSFTSNLGEISELEELKEEEEEEEEKGEEQPKPQLKSLSIPSLSSLKSQQKPSELNKSSYVRKTRTLGLDLFSTKDKSSVDEQKSEPVRRSLTSRLFPSIQSRRTTPQMLTVRTPLPMLSETEDDEEEDLDLTDSTNDHNSKLPSSDNSDISPVPATPLTPSTVKSMVHSWRWPKRPFSPAREKKEIEQIKSADNPADHIGKVGSNIWAKKTLGQLRKYHQRHSPSMLTKGFGLANSPLKESSPLLSPVSDLSDSKKSPTVAMPEQPLETINEEDEEDEGIGIWSSEEVDLTDSGADDKSPRSPTIIAPIEESEEPQGMKVSPEHLTVVGGPSVNNRESPNASTTSLTLRSNPSISSLAKHNAKPLYETTFTISNITEAPLRYEILWPAFRFDVSPAYGIVKPQSVEVVKVSVMNKHILAGSRRDETRDSRKFMGILNNKGSEKTEVDKPLMGRTRIIVLCENGERKEVIVDIVQIKKKTKGEIENLRSKNTKEVEDGNFIRRIGKSSGRSISRTVDDLIKAAKARTRKSAPKQERIPRSPSNNNLKGKSSINKATGSSSKPASAPALRRSASSGPTSRPSSPESSNKHYNSSKRKHTTASSSSSSRPNTPDIYRSQNERNKRSMSPSPVSRSRTPDESRQTRHLPQRKNFIYIGTPSSVSCPDTTVREENHSVFRIHNPTNKPVTWHLTTATNPFLRRSDSANSSQKINDEVFLIMKTSGLLRAGTTEKVVISFRPMFVGTYSQSFNLEDSSSSETSGGLGGVSVRIQGEGKIDSPNQNRSSDSKKHGSGSNKAIDFEVSETKIQIPATRVSRRRSVGIKINNPTNQLIRIKCKCEVGGTSSNSNSAISIPLSSVQIKPRAFVLLPVRFSPKETGEVQGIVKLQAVGRSEVQVEINAEGVMDASTSTTTEI